ncbi:ependymin-related protein 1-like [Mytilus trossulus]|uniref:ependymin-related protein 1-like n=1 Tax=Mytilus trossulus TaxID=6551 RepID=UPI003005A096
MLCGILAVVVIPTLVFACCPPKQWEGIEYTALGSTGADGKTHYTEIEQKVSVDTDRRMVYVAQSMVIDGANVMQKVLQNYNTATQYITKNGNCEKMGVTSVEPGCIPQNATAVLKSYMGAGSSKIMTTVYKYDTGMSTSYITMADDGCIPMAYEAAGQNADGGGYQMTVEFFGITPGIADTSVFNVPAQCGANVPAFAGIGVGRR